jgi:KaiC/GvpD/RAD55 family RecA-like ATPase
VADIFTSDRLPTGVEALDRELDGGIPPGSVVAYQAPPASQSELLLYELTNTRPTLYLTTDRTEDAVSDAFERANCPTGNPQIRFVPGDAPLENANRLIRSLGEGANLVIDPSDMLERSDRNRYQNFMNDLQNHMRNTGSLAVLHCMRGADTPALRTTTEHMADVVFDLRQAFEGTEVETRLAVPKFRGGHALTDTIKLELADRVRVDTSRDIA